MSKLAERPNALTRLLDTPSLALVVARTPAESLHQIIRYHGVDACRDLVAAARPDQLAAILDLDLWGKASAGQDDQFDVDRFGEWVEGLVNAGEVEAAQIFVNFDTKLLVAGLSRYISVFDVSTFEPTFQSDDEPLEHPDRFPNRVKVEIAGCEIRPRRSDSWDAIVALLIALQAGHKSVFNAVMSGCRELSDSGREMDGLDDLLTAPEQILLDVAGDREARRTERGYLMAADARAFLEMARRPRAKRDASEPETNPIVAAYMRAADEASSQPAATADAAAAFALPAAGSSPDSLRRQQDDAEPFALVAELLADAGVSIDGPRALLHAPASASGPARLGRIRALMDGLRDSNPNAFFARTHELAFLGNALAAGCSMLSRPLTELEAFDAAVATCNLGLELLADESPAPISLIVAFELGWETVYRSVNLLVSEQLADVLAHVHSPDTSTQAGIRNLRRVLLKQRKAGTPWLVHDALDVVAILDTPTWTALLGLLSECPSIPDAMMAIVERRTTAIDPTSFQFISSPDQLQQIRSFADRLVDLLAD